MEATHTPLRDVLTPGIRRNNTELPTLASAQGNVILLEVAEHHKAMIEHLRSGNREPYNSDELTDIANRVRMSFPAPPHNAPLPRPRRPHSAAAEPAETRTQPRQRLKTSGQKRAEHNNCACALPLLELFG